MSVRVRKGGRKVSRKQCVKTHGFLTVRKGAERFPVSVVSKCCVNNTILADAATAAAAAADAAAAAVTVHIPGIASAVTVSAAAVSAAAASAASVSAAGADAFAL